MHTIDELRAVLDYEPETGIFRWKASVAGLVAGDIAGWLNEKGYRRICFEGKYYRAHRLAIAFATGVMPPANLEPDHINGVRDDNRIANLRLATHSQNSKAHRSKGSAGTRYKGITKSRRRWQAQIRIEGKQTYLGSFLTPEDAARAYDAAASTHFGLFADLNFPL